MTAVDLYRAPDAPVQDRITNDFSFVIATVNGTGSQTSNTTLLRTLFRMGVPVNGKNLFPSNIYGLPTWFYIRLNQDGYLAHKAQAEVLVAYNFDTFARDVNDLPPGGVLIYPMDDPDGRKKKWDVMTPSRDDIYIYRVPVDQLMAEVNPPQKLKEYVANMAYVGALAYLYNIDMGLIESALDFHFAGKSKAIDLNFGLVKLTYEWAEENLEKLDPYWVEPIEGTFSQDHILIDGNSAAALGATFGSVQLAAWYPITPSSSVAESLQGYLKQYRTRPDGKATYTIIQAEDELAAIGMTIGGGWAGARSMTATSGPGISLMAEFAGLAYYAEIPIVVWNVQRVGPSTGLPTRTSQGDLLFTHYLSHGDTRQICLLPSNMEEIFQFGWQAFDIAEQFQTPVFVLSDLDLGMNQHIARRFDYPPEPMQHGKVVTAEQLEEWGTKWGRYLDLDGDAVPYRSLPGTDHPLAAYFTRGTGHDPYGNYSEAPDVWQENLDRLQRKFENMRDKLPQPIVSTMDGAKVGIISYGSNDYAIQEARDCLLKHDFKTDYMRVLALPLSYAVTEFVANHDYVCVVENNHDGQMMMIMRIEIPEYATRFRAVARCNGMPLDAEWITDKILEMEQ